MSNQYDLRVLAAPQSHRAEAADPIIEAVAKALDKQKYKRTEHPPEVVPSEADLCQEPTLWDAADRVLLRDDLLKQVRPCLEPLTKHLIAPNVLDGAQWYVFNDQALGRLRFQLAYTADGMAFGCDVEDLQKALYQAAQKGDNQPKHFLGPIVAEWQARPPEVDRNDRPDPLFPAPIVMVEKKHRQGLLFSVPAHARATNRGGAMYFPRFAADEEQGRLVSPALPLVLYDLGKGLSDRPQRAAPLALRIFVEACLSVPLKERGQDRAVRLPPMRFAEFLKRLYPGGAKNWRRRQLGELLNAFEALESSQARISWQGPDGTGGLRRVVIPIDIPREGRLDDWVRFDVNLPPGSEKGPLVDRPVLIKTGARSATQYRLALSLSFHWYQPGRLQRPMATGTPWRQTRDASLYPEVSNQELIAMTFPTGQAQDGTYRRRLNLAKTALNVLVAEGFAAIAPKQRIYPGEQWVGWGTPSLETAETRDLR